MRFQAILDVKLALEAVKQNGYALQYVLNFELFVKIANELGIRIEG